MTISRVRIFILLFLELLAAWLYFSPDQLIHSEASPAGTDASGNALFWFKGNTHSHAAITLQGYSHGDSSPAEVARWYHDHGYNFVSITDHNRYNDGMNLDIGTPQRPDFLVLPGMEITSDHRYPGVIQEGEIKIHATALNISAPVEWGFDDPDKAGIINAQSRRISATGGVQILNHPNYRFQVELADILGAEQLRLFEVFNAHPRSNQAGHAGFRPAVEDLWDQVLSSGQLLYGVAADDAHDFKWYRRMLRRFGTSPPGGGWVMVKATRLSAEHLSDALMNGDFYSSTGVYLKDFTSANGYYEVELDMDRTREQTRYPWIRAAAPKVWSDDSHYVIEFIGSHGRILHAVHDQLKAGIALDESYGYVRARITYLEKVRSITGADRARAWFAWTQPVMTAVKAAGGESAQ